jgi:hypothetical protein
MKKDDATSGIPHACRVRYPQFAQQADGLIVEEKKSKIMMHL